MATRGGPLAGQELRDQVDAELTEHAPLMDDLEAEFGGEGLARADLYRFARARNWDAEAAREMLRAHVEWRQAHWPVLRSTCENELRKGKCVVQGRDKSGRPIMWWRPRYQDPGERDIQEQIRMTVWWSEVASTMLEHPTDKITLVLDRTGFSQKNVDLEYFKAVSKVLNDNYPERVAQVIVHPSGVVFASLWSVAQWFVDPVTRQKLITLIWQSQLQNYIDPANIPTHLGGTMDAEYHYEDLPDDPYTAEQIAEANARLAEHGVAALETEDPNEEEAAAAEAVIARVSEQLDEEAAAQAAQAAAGGDGAGEDDEDDDEFEDAADEAPPG